VRLRRAVVLSLRALFAHEVRTILALASVGMGVAAVLLTGAVGKGAEGQVRQGIDAAGANLLVVRPAQVKRSAARRTVRGLVTTLRLGDYRAIAALPIAGEAAPGTDAGLRLSAGSGSVQGSVLGTTSALARLRNLRLQSGRFLDEDDDGASRVDPLSGRDRRGPRCPPPRPALRGDRRPGAEGHPA
jgi:hypothetical protein